MTLRDSSLAHEHPAQLRKPLGRLDEREQNLVPLAVVNRKHPRLVLHGSPELRGELLVVDQAGELEHERDANGGFRR